MPWLPTMLLKNVGHFHKILLVSHNGLRFCYLRFICVSVAAERTEERASAVPGGQDLCQILQDVGDDVYQQYRLTRQGSDFDSQSAFHINVSLCDN